MPARIIRALDVSDSALWVRCATGAGIALILTLVRLALDPLVGDQVPFALAIGGSTLATWVAGAGGGVTAVLISAVLVQFAIVEPHFQLTSALQHGAGQAVFLTVSLTLVWQVNRWRKAEEASRRSEAKAREREAEIASIYDSAPIGLCIFDREGRYLRINRRLAELNGLPPEAHIGRTFHELLPGIVDQAGPLLRRVLDTGTPATEVEIYGELPSRPGVVRTWMENWHPVCDESGAVVGVNVAVEEITERKRVERELREANQIKDDFLATLSHELRTPLNAILGWSQMLARGGLDERLTKQAVETIFRNAQAQNKLVTDVLDVSRMLSGKLRLDVQEVNLVPLLREALDSIGPAAQAKQISVDLASDSEPVFVNVDPGRMQQVFWNLLSNAVKFTDTGGRVNVRIVPEAARTEIVVEDTGIGISSGFLPHVFDRFTQADSSTSRRHGGLGLGLSIVRHLVELHGGTVSATSEGEGRGSRFVVSLPSHSGAGRGAAAAASDKAARRARDLEGLHVLIVDDVQDARTLMTALLEREGIRVTEASSAEEAVERIIAVRPDVIIADIGMPGTDGYEFLQRVRSLSPEQGGATPAIAVTAYGGSVDRAKVMAAGFLAHVPKPIVREHLLGTLASIRGADA